MGFCIFFNYIYMCVYTLTHTYMYIHTTHTHTHRYFLYACHTFQSLFLAISRPSAAAAAKSLQSCLTLCDPIDGSPPGSPSLGFSRQEHWSGLPFPSPVHEREKWKWSRSVVSDSSRPHRLQPTRLLHPWDFPSKSTGVGCHCLLLDIIYFFSCTTSLKTWFVTPYFQVAPGRKEI